MTDPNLYLIIATEGLLGLGLVTAGMLAGWRGWLALKRQELAMAGAHDPAPQAPSASQRIEIADLKERMRKLEAIAAGVEL
ncbi:hypothetical protein [Sphingomonas qomolangmaensis]|uniref:Uncharacterized protein n=1 Tax=Sphingomonas qomolangmaensis TaxID=2918765 RepID=A0ABY5LB72_9SPHN|nr:hypothetical protein [Sphingomonas qomolangmaensis]UUL83647.1 hypothetical protein NMP03_05365 [Sphingomonas qomolangmaensis]